MKRMRFFAIIFAIFISMASGGFLYPEKTLAQTASSTVYTCPDGTTKYYDPADKKNCPKIITWVTEDDLVRWFASADAAFKSADLIGSSYQLAFKQGGNAVYNVYKNDESVTKTQAFGYILNGIPANKKAGYTTGMFGLTQQVLNNPKSTTQNIESAKQVEAIMTQLLGNESALETLTSQGGTGNSSALNNFNQYTGNLQSATNNAVNTSLDKQKKDVVDNASACSLSWKEGIKVGACIDAFFAWLITHTLLALAGWLLWMTATLMNYAISIGIMGFSDWAPDTLYPIWLVIRQIVSLFLVFAGLFLGFMYIINRGDDFKKYIPSVVIFALFVNFSYPLTRVIIDFSNIISLNVYASAVGSNSLEAPGLSVTSEKTAGKLIMNKMGLNGIVDYATGDGKVDEGGSNALNSINSVGPALLAVLYILYAAWIFFIISALIVTRTAVLAFIIIASPLLLVDKMIPKLGEAAVKVRSTFVEMLAVGPVFAIMLALTLKFLEVFNQNSELSGIGKATGGGAITMFFNMLLILIMLHIMYKVTKATSGEIGKAVAGVAEKGAGLAVGGAFFGATSMAGRKLLGGAGRALQRAGTNEAGTGWMQKDNAMSRMAFRAAGAVAERSYDARNTSFVKWGGSKLGIGAMGTPTTKGYTALLDEENKKKKQFDTERANFTQRAIKTREARIREEYNALEGDAQRKAYIAKELKSNDNDEKLKRSLLNDDFKKEKSKEDQAISDWKLRASDPKGQAEFYKEQSEAVRRRIDDGVAKEAEEKAYRSEMLNAQKAIAGALNKQPQTDSGSNQNKQSSSQSSTQANNQGRGQERSSTNPGSQGNTSGGTQNSNTTANKNTQQGAEPKGSTGSMTLETPEQASARVKSTEEKLDSVVF